MFSFIQLSYQKIFSIVSKLLCIFVFFNAGCAYNWGHTGRSLPGGYQQIVVPIFKNKTYEPGIEVSFTNSLIQEFERSRVARITDVKQAEVIVEGEIVSIDYAPGGKKEGGTLPTGAVLASEYRILTTARITVRRIADKSILWTGLFNGERTYVAPQVGIAGVNTVNPLYNLSARRQNIDVMAQDMMSEAHDRITENF